MRLLGIVLLTTPILCAQTIVRPERFPSLVKMLEPQAGEKELKCGVTQIHPTLNYSFRFQTGFVLSVPMDQYLGTGHRWVILEQITPDSGKGKPVFFASGVRLPDVPKTNVELQVTGGFLVGLGRYAVHWVMVDDTGRVCRSSWVSDAKLTHLENKVKVAMAPNTVAEFSLRGSPDTERTRADAPPMRVTVLLHAASLSPRRAVLNGRDQLTLLSTLSSLLERLPASSVRLVMFNLEQQRVLMERDGFTLDGVDEVAQSLNSLQLGRVDVKVLANPQGHQELLADLLNHEITAEPRSDVVILLGPRTRFVDKMPASALEQSHRGAQRYFNFQVRPFFLNVANVPDAITLAIARLKGKTFSMNSPAEFARALDQVIAHAPPPSSDQAFRQSERH